MPQPSFLDLIPLPPFHGLRLGVTGARALERFSDLASGAQRLADQAPEQRLDLIDECLDLVLIDPAEPAGFQFAGATLAQFWAAWCKSASADQVARWRKALLAPEVAALRDGARDRIGRRDKHVWLESRALWLPEYLMPVTDRHTPDALVRLFQQATPGWSAGRRSPRMVELVRQVGAPGVTWPDGGQDWPAPPADEVLLWTLFDANRLQPRVPNTWYQEYQLCLPSLETSYFPDWFMVRNGFAHLRLTGFTDEQGNLVLLIDDVFSEWLRDLELQRLGQPLAPSRLTLHRQPDDPLYEIDTQYTPRPVPDCPVAPCWVDLVAEAIVRIAITQRVDRIAWMPAALLPELYPERAVAPMQRLFNRQLPVALRRQLRQIHMDDTKPQRVEVDYPTYGRALRLARQDSSDLVLVDRQGEPVRGPFETMDEALEAYRQANPSVEERLPAFVMPAATERLDRFADATPAPRSRAGWLFEQARALDEEQAGGHGGRWSVFDDDVEGFVERWLPRAVQEAKVVTLGVADGSGQDRLVAAGEPRGAGLLYADRAEDARQAGLMAVIAMDVESDTQPGQRSNILWSAYPFFAEGLRYPVRIESIGLHPNRLEARLELAVAGMLVYAFDPLFYQHRGLYRAGEHVTFSLCALAYHMGPTPEQEIVIDDPERIRAFHARDAWVRAHGSWSKDADEEASLAAWTPESDEDLEPIHIDLSRGAWLLPSEQGPADDAGYQGEVLAVTPEVYRLFGVAVWRVDVVVAKPDDEDFVLPIYVTEHGFADGWRPTPGENVSGSAWVQGWMVPDAAATADPKEPVSTAHDQEQPPMTDDPQVQCDHCAQTLGERYTALERRIDQVRMLDADDVEDGAPNWEPQGESGWGDLDADDALIEGIEPLDAAEVASYCGEACWSAAEADWIERLGLKHPYPDEGVLAPCSRCGQMIDRTEPHVSYSVVDNAFFTDADGNACMTVHGSTCLAVLCHRCEAADVFEDEALVPDALATTT